MSADAHGHLYRRLLQPRSWVEAGSRRRRDFAYVPVCKDCGAEQPSRRPRKTARREVECTKPSSPPVHLPEARTVAAELLHYASPEVRARGLLNALARKGLTGSHVAELLDVMLDAALVSITYKTERNKELLHLVRVPDRVALEEFAHPGLRAARAEALSAAKKRLEGLQHPFASEAARVLLSEGEELSVDVIQALTALAVHAENGEPLAERVFSARYLGDSKKLRRLRGRIERLMGPVEQAGIREGTNLVLIGKNGTLHLEGQIICLSTVSPYIGLPREVLAGLEVEFPPDGVFAAENLAVFEACCRGEVANVGSSLVVFLGGWPGRGERLILEAAARRGARVRVWADLDLAGVLIARRVARWVGAIECFGMSPKDLERAPMRATLNGRSRARIERELRADSRAMLADTLQAILDNGQTAEQEAFLGIRPIAASDGQDG